jgi:hypothetical protein
MEKELGFRKAYKMTGTPGYAGGPGDKKMDTGTSGSHRDSNWKKGAAQAKTANADKIGPYNNLKGTSGSLY